MATKKKPYSRIENGRELRRIAFDHRRNMKALAKAKAPDWFAHLVAETDLLAEKVVKLQDFLWVRETEDSPTLYSPESGKVCPKSRRLLVRQHKAMNAYLKILVDRVKLGWPKDPENLPCRKCEKKAKQ